MDDRIPRPLDEWRAEIAVLVARLKARGHQGKDCVLTPRTALMAAQGLAVWAAAPTREDIGCLWCNISPKCPSICNNRIGRVNQFMALYQDAQRAGGEAKS
jgi:hypothetical protein